MLDSILDWFGQRSGKTDDLKNHMSIMDVHNAHIKCKVDFHDYLCSTSAEKLDAMLISRDDSCALGQWIHGPALQQLHQHGAFYTLRADHAQLHIVAGKVVEKVKINAISPVVAVTDMAYVQVSRKVMKAISELNKQLKTS